MHKEILSSSLLYRLLCPKFTTDPIGIGLIQLIRNLWLKTSFKYLFKYLFSLKRKIKFEVYRFLQKFKDILFTKHTINF
jgi:hypothetical protein